MSQKRPSKHITRTRAAAHSRKGSPRDMEEYMLALSPLMPMRITQFPNGDCQFLLRNGKGRMELVAYSHGGAGYRYWTQESKDIGIISHPDYMQPTITKMVQAMQMPCIAL